MTLTGAILRHLKEYKSITSFEAFTEYGGNPTFGNYF